VNKLEHVKNADKSLIRIIQLKSWALGGAGTKIIGEECKERTGGETKESGERRKKKEWGVSLKEHCLRKRTKHAKPCSCYKEKKAGVSVPQREGKRKLSGHSQNRRTLHKVLEKAQTDGQPNTIRRGGRLDN